MDKQIMGVDLLREIELTLAGGEIWIAYNAIPYQLEKATCIVSENKVKQ